MKKRFTLLGLLIAVAFIAITFSLVDVRRQLADAHRENAILKFQASVARHDELKRLLATDDRYDRPDILSSIADRIEDDKKASAIPWIENKITELEDGLSKFSRISADEYDAAIERIKSLDFDLHTRIRESDAVAIVDFIVLHPHVDPRVIRLEPWHEGSIKVTTGELSDGWGFEYVARKDRGKWIVRYYKGWTLR